MRRPANTRNVLGILVLCALLSVCLWCSANRGGPRAWAQNAGTPIPTAPPTDTPTPGPSPTATASPTVTPTATATATPTPRGCLRESPLKSATGVGIRWRELVLRRAPGGGFGGGVLVYSLVATGTDAALAEARECVVRLDQADWQALPAAARAALRTWVEGLVTEAEAP